jgi:sulfur carrier protein
MTILLNGKTVQLPSEVTTIQDLLTHYQLENRIVIVEQNKDIVYKEQYSSSMLSDKDKIEIIHFVGGG